MNYEDYSFELDEWLKRERDVAALPRTSKAFIGDRPYRHFDARVSLRMLESNEVSTLVSELKNPILVSSHSFYPFIRNDKKVRRFVRETNKDGVRVPVIKQKLRPIMYASHKDAVLLGFYAYLLKCIYDRKAPLLGVDETVIAYRKIPRNDSSGRNKSNIDFANDVYKSLPVDEDSAILCLDVSDFFGSMVHTNLEKRWCELLAVDQLPVGHKTIFKSITRYRYVFSDEVRTALKLGEVREGKFRYAKHAKLTGPLSTSKDYNKYVSKSKIIRVHGSPCGIPQGSPISDILANMYLIDFDRYINDLVSRFPAGVYRRYSDDIIIICPQDKIIELYEYAKERLAEEGLRINDKKTELFYIDRSVNILSDQTGLLLQGYDKNRKAIQYLGFEFDLADINVRSGTIANHYRKLKRSMKKNSAPKKDEKLPGAERKQSKGRSKRDKYAYIKLASNLILSERLGRQFENVKKRVSRLRRTYRNSIKK